MNYLNHYLLEDDASNVRKKWIICSNKVLFLYKGFETCAKFQLVKANSTVISGISFPTSFFKLNGEKCDFPLLGRLSMFSY